MTIDEFKLAIKNYGYGIKTDHVKHKYLIQDWSGIVVGYVSINVPQLKRIYQDVESIVAGHIIHFANTPIQNRIANKICSVTLAPQAIRRFRHLPIDTQLGADQKYPDHMYLNDYQIAILKSIQNQIIKSGDR